MNLGDIIKRLRTEDPLRVVKNGFGKAHSYRGYYDQLAFEPVGPASIGAMLRDCEDALGGTFTGYKGGECWMEQEDNGLVTAGSLHPMGRRLRTGSGEWDQYWWDQGAHPVYRKVAL